MIRNLFRRKKEIRNAGHETDEKQLLYRNALQSEPENSKLHYEFAGFCLAIGRIHLAYAEIRTALCLDADVPAYRLLRDQIENSLPPKDRMEHNQHFRFSSVADEIDRLRKDKIVSVLDVGGGEGQLAQFLPSLSYFLAEPATNGIAGTAPRPGDASFDYVVACHVLEHVVPEMRTDFMDQLLQKARTGLILLNPFYITGTSVEDRLRLIFETTGAQWAREHLECTLPELEFVRSYAESRELRILIQPNGTLWTSLALVYMDHFARISGQMEKREKVMSFFNHLSRQALHSESQPVAYLVSMIRNEPL